MAGTRQEVESPLVHEWEFMDELGIIIDIGRFIIPSSDSETINSRMGKYTINDGRTVVGRTETFREVGSRTITFAKMPYNFVKELKNRVGARFRIKDCWKDYLWAALESMEANPIQNGIWARTEQMYNVTLNFIQVNPI